MIVVLTLSLVACGKKNNDNSSVSTTTGTKFKAGTYEGTAKGFGGDIIATVKLTDDKIAEITVVGDGETGPYGCVKSKEDKYFFREGLFAMLDELEPEVVLVYGSMPKQIFKDLENRTTFINIPDWISRKKAGVA